jgi:hypothetical protein
MELSSEGACSSLKSVYKNVSDSDEERSGKKITAGLHGNCQR